MEARTHDDCDTGGIRYVGDVGCTASDETDQHNISEKTFERGTQSEFIPVDQITVPTNVYCVLGGEHYHTSRISICFSFVLMSNLFV